MECREKIAWNAGPYCQDIFSVSTEGEGLAIDAQLAIFIKPDGFSRRFDNCPPSSPLL
jgi:hypothetical protein